MDNRVSNKCLELNKRYWLDPYTTGVYIGVNNGREERVLRSSFGFNEIEYRRQPFVEYNQIDGIVWFTSDTDGFKPYNP